MARFYLRKYTQIELDWQPFASEREAAASFESTPLRENERLEVINEKGEVIGRRGRSKDLAKNRGQQLHCETAVTR